jgi:hypothetical protein
LWSAYSFWKAAFVKEVKLRIEREMLYIILERFWK